MDTSKIDSVLGVVDYLLANRLIYASDSEIGAVTDIGDAIRENIISADDVGRHVFAIYGKTFDWPTHRMGNDLALKYVATHACRAVRLHTYNEINFGEFLENAELCAKKMHDQTLDGAWDFLLASERLAEQEANAAGVDVAATKKNPNRKVKHGGVKDAAETLFNENPGMKKKDYVELAFTKLGIPKGSATVYFYDFVKKAKGVE